MCLALGLKLYLKKGCMLSTQDFDLQKGRDDSTGPEKMN